MSKESSKSILEMLGKWKDPHPQVSMFPMDNSLINLAMSQLNYISNFLQRFFTMKNLREKNLSTQSWSFIRQDQC